MITDEAAFDELRERYTADMRTLAAKYLAADKIDDAIETTFKAAREERHEFKPEWKLRPWLLSIMINVAIDEARKQALYDAIATLDPLDQSILDLVYFQKVDHRSAAETLGIRPGSMSLKLHRILGLLRMKLGRSVVKVA
ncbi:MAG TPA: sigma-70 family RNA polymerase sigma factor [Pirellulales bacterium]|jgi:DNA-directed RNA polymerase specialized sigma24 family protein|nr:sigma-70 family RNA polymerase sigma factor [Pirellulales bacterium]